jgi:hypothetical protein
LTLPAFEDLSSGIDERPRFLVVRDGDRLALRLVRDISGQREQILAVKRQRRRLLALGAAEIDALLALLFDRGRA